MSARSTTVRSRVLVGIVALLAFHTTVIALTTFGIWRAKHQQERFLQERLRRSELLPKLRASLLAEHATTSLLFFDPSAGERARRALEAQEQTTSRLLDQLSTLVRDDPAQVARVAELRATNLRLSRERRELLAKPDRVLPGGAARDDFAESLRVQNAARGLVWSIASGEWERVAQNASVIEHSSELLLWLVPSLGVLAVLLGVVLLRRTDLAVRAQAGAQSALATSEQAARHAHEELAQVYRYAPVGLFSLDRDGCVLRVNQYAATLTGLPPEALIGKPVGSWAPDLEPALRESVRAVVATGAPRLGIELHRDGRDGAEAEVDWVLSLYPIQSADGSFLGVSGAVLDITEHKRALTALARSEATFSTLVDSTSDFILSVDAERFALLTFNRGMREHFQTLAGVELKVGMTLDQYMPTPEAVERWKTMLTRALAEGSLSSDYQSALGNKAMHLRIHKLTREEHVFGLAVFARDVTVERQALAELRRAHDQLEAQVAARTAELESAYETLRAEKERLSALLQSMDDQIWFLDLEHHLTLLNPATIRPGLVAPPPDTNVEAYLSAFELLHPDGRPIAPGEMPARRALEGESVRGAEVVLRESRTGALVYTQVNASPVRDASGKILGVVSMARDVTEQKRSEAARRQAEQRLALLLENAPLAVVEWSASDTKILRWAGDAPRILGWTAEETVGTRLDQLPWPHPEEVGRVRALFRELLSGNVHRQVTKQRNLRKDGSLVYCEWYTSILTDAASGTQLVLSLGLDVTERERLDEERTRLVADLEQSNAQLKELDRLKSMFIASVSHELRTPLNSILGFTGVILQGLAGPVSDEQKKQLTMVKQSGEQLLALITDVIDISKIEAGIVTASEESELDMRALVDDLAESLIHAAREKGLTIEVLGEPARTRSDPRRVRQILGNLLHNAIKFTDRGTITLRVTDTGEGVEVTVRDTGIGIAREDLDKLFQPFVQLRTPGRPRVGTGLGLHLSRKLAVLLGGTLSVESEVGKGSTFRLWLPRYCARRAS